MRRDEDQLYISAPGYYRVVPAPADPHHDAPAQQVQQQVPAAAETQPPTSTMTSAPLCDARVEQFRALTSAHRGDVSIPQLPSLPWPPADGAVDAASGRRLSLTSFTSDMTDLSGGPSLSLTVNDRPGSEGNDESTDQLDSSSLASSVGAANIDIVSLNESDYQRVPFGDGNALVTDGVVQGGRTLIGRQPGAATAAAPMAAAAAAGARSRQTPATAPVNVATAPRTPAQAPARAPAQAPERAPARAPAPQRTQAPALFSPLSPHPGQ